ncbi:MAG TPA: histone deacetylase [Candidatus Saccharimonadales bacterium]|jgi:acetoin utilization deacetylase AcuC-like enzyme|nr:histone deacetylase [Candidatus Saccharimonadales bacterium]
MLPFKLIYHPQYDLDLGTHVFPSQKFRLIHEALLAEGIADAGDFLKPEQAPNEDILRVHTQAYVNKLLTDSLTLSERMKLEIPLTELTRNGFWLAAGGSTLAGLKALEDGFAANLSGGFHHAYPGHGEGFCMIHDVAVAIRSLQATGKIRTAMTVDTDVHHGNGTAAIFMEDPTVFTLSIHQQNNYPEPKPPSDEDIGLADGTRDHEYLDALEEGLLHSFKKMTPDLIFYVGGADPYREDQLGGLALTLEGLQQRDKLVFEHARRRGIPVASTLAGGYARRVADTVRIHMNTIIAARDVLLRQIPTGS